MTIRGIDLQLFGEGTPQAQGAPNSLQDAMSRMGYADGPDGMTKGEAQAAPPQPEQSAQPSQATQQGQPAIPGVPVAPEGQVSEPPSGDRVGEALAKLATILERQGRATPPPPTVPLPPEPALPPLPEQPDWLKSDDSWEEHYSQNPARATRDLMAHQDQVKEAQRQRQEMTARYEVEKDNALKKQELSLGFYEQANMRGDQFVTLEPVALQILLKDQPELLQTMPPKLAIKVAFDTAARLAATAPTPQPPPTPAAEGAAIPGQSPVGQVPQLTPQQLAEIKRQGVTEYLRTLVGQAGHTPPVPGTGTPPVLPAQPIHGARDATRALRASLGG